MSAPPTNKELVFTFHMLGIFAEVDHEQLSDCLYRINITRGSRLWETDGVPVAYESDKNYDDCYAKIIESVTDIRPSWIKLAQCIFTPVTPDLCVDRYCHIDLNCIRFSYQQQGFSIVSSFSLPTDDFAGRYAVYDRLLQNIEDFANFHKSPWFVEIQEFHKSGKVLDPKLFVKEYLSNNLIRVRFSVDTPYTPYIPISQTIDNRSFGEKKCSSFIENIDEVIRCVWVKAKPFLPTEEI